MPQSLDSLLKDHISEPVAQRLAGTSTFSQISQIITNLEYFEAACSELESSLTTLR